MGSAFHSGLPTDSGVAAPVLQWSAMGSAVVLLWNGAQGRRQVAV